VIGGDFNIMRYSFEKNKLSQLNRYSSMFNSIIHMQESREIEISGGQYTWSNNQGQPTLEKLDRILITWEWEKFFPSVHVYKLPREISDNNPLSMVTRQNPTSRKRDFRFERYWLKNDECMEKLREIWGQPTRDSKALDRVQFKLRKVKNFLKGWGFNKIGSNKKKEERD
jgi:hypothetical protein